MIPFKGRSRFKVNIPRKPVDEGIKVWVVADSKLWVYYFEIDIVEKEEREKMKKISQKTLIRLAQTLPTKKFLIYSDSYFGGAETAKELTKLGFNICLSCTSIRLSWLFTKFLHRYLKVGQCQSAIVEFNQDKWLYVTIFLQKKKSGKKYFNLISNCETDSLVEIKKTIYLKKEKKEKVIKKPANILDYRNHLGYVDSFNQRTNTYWFPHKTQSWKKKIIIWVFKLLVSNAFTLYNEINDLQNYSYKKFTVELIDFLVGKKSEQNQHQLIRIGKKGTNKRLNCAFCWKFKNKMTSTEYKCTQCNTGLHKKCFEISHWLIKN